MSQMGRTPARATPPIVIGWVPNDEYDCTSMYPVRPLPWSDTRSRPLDDILRMARRRA
jgi:hypothetical protein